MPAKWVCKLWIVIAVCTSLALASVRPTDVDAQVDPLRLDQLPVAMQNAKIKLDMLKQKAGPRQTKAFDLSIVAEQRLNEANAFYSRRDVAGCKMMLKKALLVVEDIRDLVENAALMQMPPGSLGFEIASEVYGKQTEKRSSGLSAARIGTSQAGAMAFADKMIMRASVFLSRQDCPEGNKLLRKAKQYLDKAKQRSKEGGKHRVLHHAQIAGKFADRAIEKCSANDPAKRSGFQKAVKLKIRIRRLHSLLAKMEKTVGSTGDETINRYLKKSRKHLRLSAKHLDNKHIRSAEKDLVISRTLAHKAYVLATKKNSANGRSGANGIPDFRSLNGGE